MVDKIRDKRNEIDQIDQKILQLLSDRGRVAQEIGQIKQSGGKTVFVPEREDLLLKKLAKLNPGPYRDEAIKIIYKEIISATRSLEAPLTVAYLGPVATFTHLAAQQYFGSSSTLLPLGSVADIFERVEKGESDYGVVPIENSTEGVVNHTLDLFVDSTVKICAELILRVEHHLLSQEKDLQKVKTVYSHAHALAQCRHFLSTHLPHAVLKDATSTAHSAQLAKRHRGVAAIGSEIAGRNYGLNVLAPKIQDNQQNFTRFLVIGFNEVQKTGSDKTSILFGVRDEVGALYKALGIFAKNKVNLTKVESRPLKKKAWEYLFFADLDGHLQDTSIHSALQQIEKMSFYFQNLGSYPKFK